jgi:hypothetical protein
VLRDLVNGVCRDAYGRNSKTACLQLLLHLKAAHSRHRHVEQEARDGPQFARR